MKFDDLVRTGQLKKEKTSHQKLSEFVAIAEEELSAAKFNLDRFPLQYEAVFSESREEIKNSIEKAETLDRKEE